MCHYQSLFQDDSIGYVVRCASCEKMQVGYGNLVITLTMEDFASFRHWMRKLKNDYHPSQKDNVRNIVIPTPCEGMKLVLSMRELCAFDHMLETADSELQSIELMKLFENN